MEKSRQTKLLAIIALILAITGMTLGFAAFSSTLTISSSATVTPSSDDFKIRIYGFKDSDSLLNYVINRTYEESYLSSTQGYATPTANVNSSSVATINNSEFTISNLNIEFKNQSAQVVYLFIVRNEGEYDAYIDLSEFTKSDEGYNLVSGNIMGTCVSETTMNNELVNSACRGIYLQHGIFDITTFNNKSTNNDYFKIPAGGEEIIGISIYYNGPWSDEVFSVNFPAIEYKFSTTK